MEVENNNNSNLLDLNIITKPHSSLDILNLPTNQVKKTAITYIGDIENDHKDSYGEISVTIHLKITKLNGHSGYVNSVIQLKDGRICSGACDNTVRFT